MPFEVRLPALGDDEDAPEEAKVSFWYVDEGESVEKDDDLVEMVTDKAAFSVPSPVSGKILSVLAKEGEAVRVGEVIATVEE
jgi:pyruvate/2-oxoglutarate dehydrogenase complex dihydrolipoamide acyltransferase (E2) component